VSAYYSQAPPSREPGSRQPWLLLAHGSASCWRWFQRGLRRANLRVVVGLLLAHAMALLFYLTLVNHMVQVNSRRLAAELQARQRHECALLPQRLRRDQCLASLTPPGAGPAAVLAGK